MKHQTRRRVFLKSAASISVFGTVAIAGCSSSFSRESVVDITSGGFEPRNVRISIDNLGRGSIAWQNVDTEREHAVASASMNWNFESDILPPRSEDEEPVGTGHVFPGTGTYDAICPEHGDPDTNDQAKMRIVVGDEEEAEPL